MKVTCSIPAGVTNTKALVFQGLSSFSISINIFSILRSCCLSSPSRSILRPINTLMQNGNAKRKCKTAPSSYWKRGVFLYDPKAVNRLIRAVPYVENRSHHRARQMPIHSNDHLFVRMIQSYVANRFLKITVSDLQAKYVLQKPVVTAYTQLVTSLLLGNQIQQSVSRMVSYAQSCADCSANAVLFYDLFRIPIVKPIHGSILLVRYAEEIHSQLCGTIRRIFILQKCFCHFQVEVCLPIRLPWNVFLQNLAIV